MSSSRARVCRGKLLTDSGLLNQMASGESLKPEEENLCGDRFSSLPDALAYLILSFVDLEDFARLLAVSRRWKHLSLSAPYLSMVNDASRLQGSLDYYFSKRGKEHKIEQLRVVCKGDQNCADNDEHPEFEYLRKCVESFDPENVDLNLLLREGECCKPPVSLFLVSEVRNLALTMNNAALRLHPIFKFPSYPKCCFPTPFRLEKLTLNSVKISSKCLGSMISQLCPNLKLLRLHECSGLECLVIKNRCVEHLEIIQEKSCDLSSLTVYCLNLKTLLITFYPESLNSPSLCLSMPKVEHFEWRGFPPHFYEIGPMYIHLKSTTIYCTWPTGRNLDECCSKYLSCIVMAIMETKSLHLLARTIEILFSQVSKAEILSSIKGVETLYIDDCYLTDDEVPAIAFILEKMCNLKNIYVSLPSKAAEGKLDLSKEKKMSGFKMDYWEAQNLKFIQQLRTATFVITVEGNATELVKYFAKHGKVLQNLRVFGPSDLVSAVFGQVTSVKPDVQGFSVHAIQRSSVMRNVL